jgi:hypothetical protein
MPCHCLPGRSRTFESASPLLRTASFTFTHPTIDLVDFLLLLPTDTTPASRQSNHNRTMANEPRYEAHPAHLPQTHLTTYTQRSMGTTPSRRITHTTTITILECLARTHIYIFRCTCTSRRRQTRYTSRACRKRVGSEGSGAKACCCCCSQGWKERTECPCCDTYDARETCCCE